MLNVSRRSRSMGTIKVYATPRAKQADERPSVNLGGKMAHHLLTLPEIFYDSFDPAAHVEF